MNREIKEPAGTIRAELARRRRTVGWLSAATGISKQTLHRRLASPDDLTLAELGAIATALEVDPGVLFAASAPEVAA